MKLNTTGAVNTAIGLDTLVNNNTGNENTATGGNALFTNTGGVQNTANGTFTLFSNTIGNLNAAVGRNALVASVNGNSNTAIGRDALQGNTSGSNNTALGAGAGTFLTTGNNNIDIGNNGVAGESSMIRIGDLAVHTGIFLAGITATTPVAPNRQCWWILRPDNWGERIWASLEDHQVPLVQPALRVQQAPSGQWV